MSLPKTLLMILLTVPVAIMPGSMDALAAPDETIHPTAVDLRNIPAELQPTMIKLMTLLKGHRLPEAHALEAKWLAHHKGSEAYYQEVAGAYFGVQLYNEVRRVADAGLKLYPDNFDLHLFKAKAWAAVGEIDLAQPELVICQKMRPNSADVHYEWALLLNSRDDYKGALKEISLDLATRNTDPNHFVLKAYILRNLNRVSESVDALNRAIAIGSHSPYFDMCNARIVLARQLQKLKRFPAALEQYQLAQKFNKRAPYKMCVEIGQCCLEMGNPSEALQNFEQSLKVDGDYLPAHRGRLAALEALKETDLADKERAAIKQIEADFKPNH